MSFTNFRSISRSFLQHDGLPFADILSEATINRVANDAGVPTDPTAVNADDGDGVIYTAAVTLWAFLSQVLHAEANR